MVVSISAQEVDAKAGSELSHYKGNRTYYFYIRSRDGKLFPLRDLPKSVYSAEDVVDFNGKTIFGTDQGLWQLVVFER